MIQFAAYLVTWRLLKTVVDINAFILAILQIKKKKKKDSNGDLIARSSMGINPNRFNLIKK